MPKRRAKAKVVVQDLVSPANAALVAEGARRCPICQAPMQTERRNDETIDVCNEHGIWLDRNELERMFLRRMRRVGVRMRRARAEAHTSGALSGMFWGALLA